MRNFPSLALTLLALFLATGCQSYDPRLASRQTEYLHSSSGAAHKATTSDGYDPVSYWDGDGISGAPAIKISLSEQRAYFTKGGELVGVSQVSTGREGNETKPGKFKVYFKHQDHYSNLYGDFVDADGNVIMANISSKDKKPPGAVFKGAPMPYFMQFAPAIGMHGGFLPGYPASHGCIRMPEKMAAIFFENVSKGTPVDVVP